MPKKKDTSLERMHKHLYSLDADHKLTPKELEQLTRYRDGYNVWMNQPMLAKKQIAAYLVQTYKIDKSQAYRDIQNLEILLGNVQLARKEWYRYTVIEMAKETYAMAKKKKDTVGMAAATEKLGKFTKLDKPEVDEIPWDDIIPPSWEPTADVSVIENIQPVDDIEAYRKRMRKKYDPDYVEDVEHEEL